MSSARDQATKLAAATSAAAMLASLERWQALCEEVGVEDAHAQVLDAVTEFVAGCNVDEDSSRSNPPGSVGRVGASEKL